MIIYNDVNFFMCTVYTYNLQVLNLKKKMLCSKIFKRISDRKLCREVKIKIPNTFLKNWEIQKML